VPRPRAATGLRRLAAYVLRIGHDLRIGHEVYGTIESMTGAFVRTTRSLARSAIGPFALLAMLAPFLAPLWARVR
jgi:hypothetical protein